MGLSCSCTDDSGWYHIPPDDFSTLKTKTRKRCKSCKRLINIGDCCGEFETLTYDEYGDEKSTPTLYFCEECTGLYFSLEDLGFCLEIGGSMRDLVQEYADEYGPRK